MRRKAIPTVVSCHSAFAQGFQLHAIGARKITGSKSSGAAMLRFSRPAIIFVCVALLCLGLFSWFAVSKVTGANSMREYERQSASEFLFEQRPFQFRCTNRPQPLPPGEHSWFSSPGIAPYARTRVEGMNIPLAEAPSLTIVSEPLNWIRIAGEDRDDWQLRFCAIGEGDSVAEARQFLDKAPPMSRTGDMISLSATDSKGRTGSHGDLLAQIPREAPLTVHTIGAIEVRNLSGPMRLSATGGRATILNTTGTVDANGEIVDFAGARGRVILNSFSEIDIKITGPRFVGSLSAYGQREVRVIVPRGFQSPIEVMVGRKDDFVCRADFCSGMKRERDGGAYRFRYAGSGETASDHVSFRSDHSTVVIDNWKANPLLGAERRKNEITSLSQ